MSAGMRGRALAPGAAALAVAGLLGLGCARSGTRPPDITNAAPAADSVTVALWRMDEATGTRCMDSGPFRIDGSLGPGTRGGFGRFAGAREFTRVIDSFVVAPNNPVLDTPLGFTVEAWVLAHAFGQYEDTPIAARWTEEGLQQSWLFGIVGARARGPSARLVSPGFHDNLVVGAATGQLLFAFQPSDANQPRTYFSTQRIQLERWTHVAASYDGSVVRLFIDGRLDAQYAIRGRIQASLAPVLIGNYFDARRLTGFSGELRMESGGDDNPYYAFEGLIDELRISNVARTVFPGVAGR